MATTRSRSRKGSSPAALQAAMAEALRQFSQSGATAQRRVLEAFGAAQETLQGRVGSAREQAQETWDNLEALFQSRVQRAMQQLGVPTAAEIRELSRRVAELNETVMALSQPRRASKKTAAKRKAPGKRRVGTKRGRTAG